MAELPSGTVTFLFTDLEASTRLWEQYPDAMNAALARHDALLRDDGLQSERRQEQPQSGLQRKIPHVKRHSTVRIHGVPDPGIEKDVQARHVPNVREDVLDLPLGSAPHSCDQR